MGVRNMYRIVIIIYEKGLCINLVIYKSFLWHCCPKYFCFFYPTDVSKLWTICVHIHISDCVQTVYKLLLLSNNTASETFTQIGSIVKCWLDIFRWGADLAVTGRICDTGRKALKTSFQTAISSSPVTAIFCSLLHFSRRPLLEIQGNQKSLCTWWLQYNRQEHRDFWSPCII